MSNEVEDRARNEWRAMRAGLVQPEQRRTKAHAERRERGFQRSFDSRKADTQRSRERPAYDDR